MTSLRLLRRPLVFWPAWHAITVAALFALNGLRSGIPPWRLSKREIFLTVILASGYLAGAFLYHLLQFQSTAGRRARLVEILTAGFAGFGAVGLYLLLGDVQVPRSALLLSLGGGMSLLLLGVLSERSRPVVLFGVGIAVSGLVVATNSGFTLAAPHPKSRGVTEVNSSLYSIRVVAHRNIFPRTTSYHSGGAITEFGDGFLIVTADGDLYQTTLDATGSVRVVTLPFSVPIDRSSFAAAAGRGAYLNYFRALDVLVRQEDGAKTVFISHHVWNPERRCFVVRISAFIETSSDQPQWRKVHDTEPCLPIVESEPGWPFRGMEGGGQMAFLDQNHLLLTVGDHGFNGVDFEDQPDYVQNPSASYGKIVLVNTRTGTWRPYSIGHRNPQGLWVDSTRVPWITEHGPQGGDELNRLVDGANYGWPQVTHGTDYGKHAWPLNPSQGRHEGYVAPVFSWVPSVGVSGLIRVRGALFGSWNGDFLLGTMVGQRLLRVRVEDGAAQFVESVLVNERIRDLIEDRLGRIILLTDSYSLLVLEPTESGFAMCAGCHTATGTPSRGLGPDLGSVLGRTVASDPSFAYSSALRQLGGVWTEERLDQFLIDPEAFAPGTSMQMPGIGDPELRRKVITYLKSH